MAPELLTVMSQVEGVGERSSQAERSTGDKRREGDSLVKVPASCSSYTSAFLSTMEPQNKVSLAQTFTLGFSHWHQQRAE